MKARFLLLAISLLLLLPGSATAAASPQVGPKDKCPVCGMFVAKYPEWTASITFSDGKTEFFDGVKDMIRFNFDTKRYAPHRKPADIRQIQVKDYYSLDPVDAKNACVSVRPSTA